VRPPGTEWGPGQCSPRPLSSSPYDGIFLTRSTSLLPGLSPPRLPPPYDVKNPPYSFRMYPGGFRLTLFSTTGSLDPGTITMRSVDS